MHRFVAWSQWLIRRKRLEIAESAPMKIGSQRRNPEYFCRWILQFLEESNAVPINLEGRAQTKASRARRNFSSQIHQDRFSLARGRAHHHIQLLPGACLGFDLECRKGKRQVRIMRRANIRHSTAKPQPSC